MKKILLAMLLSVFLLSTMTVPILSQDELTVGINVGDWFLYEGTLVEYEADEGVPFPPSPTYIFLKTFNESDWLKRTVANVSGTTITFEVVTHYKNGTDVTETIDEDITSAFTYFAIGANLTVGDEARPPRFGLPAMIINKTIEDWEYEDITRETNYCIWNYTFGGSHTWQVFWDKATGILVKWVYNASISVAQGNATWLLIQELVESNLWVIPEFPTGTVMLLIFVAVTVCVEIYRRKRLKHYIG